MFLSDEDRHGAETHESYYFRAMERAIVTGTFIKISYETVF